MQGRSHPPRPQWALLDSDYLVQSAGSAQLESPELKKEAKLPATAVTTKIAHASSATSTTFPAAVTGFVIDDDTVSS